jgi:hypothetical protein
VVGKYGATMSDLTENQKRNLQHAYENAEGLSLEDGGWQNDSAAVVETGSMIMWLLEQAFPDLFLDQGVENE